MSRGIPGQISKLTERVDIVEGSQLTCQRVLDAEVLPVLRELERRGRELTKKVELLSEEVDSLRRVPK